MSLEDRTSIALKHTNDTTKLVRIGAEQLLLDFNTLSNVDINGLTKSRNELEDMLFSNADFSNGLMQLGDYYFQTNDIKNAFKHYHAAIKKDSLLVPAYSNLASCYSMDNQPKQALKDLNKAISLEPSNSRYLYNLATYYYQNKNFEEAEKVIKSALNLEKYNQDYKYLLALIYQEQGKTSAAQLIMQGSNSNQ